MLLLSMYVVSGNDRERPWFGYFLLTFGVRFLGVEVAARQFVLVLVYRGSYFYGKALCVGGFLVFLPEILL